MILKLLALFEAVQKEYSQFLLIFEGGLEQYSYTPVLFETLMSMKTRQHSVTIETIA